MKILVVARAVPYPGIDHAGGEFLLRHTTLLARRHSVVLVAPPGADETPPGAWGTTDPPFTLLEMDGDAAPPPRGRYRWRAWVHPLVPMFQHWQFHHLLLHDRRVQEAMRDADLVELQWFEEILLARELRRRHPDKPLVGVFHDVSSQKYARDWRAVRPSLLWLVRGVRVAAALFLERQALRHLSRAIVFSEKDRALLGRGPRAATVEVLHPPLDDPQMPAAPPAPPDGERTALFVASFSREENHHAAVWLLREIWPRVLRSAPAGTLVLAGGGMTEELGELARRTPGVRVTGYLPSLAPVYRSATVAVSPVTRGAGVKFKTVVPMLWGVPVVATGAGAEGIGGRDLFYAVEDGAAGFAAAVARVLQDPGLGQPAARRAFAFATSRYSTASYGQQLDDVYGRWSTDAP